MPTPSVSHEVVSAHVLIRFALRLVILAIFAALGSRGFGKTLEGLLALAAVYCIVIAAVRREAPLGPVLTHFDEAAAYAVIGRLAVAAA